MLSIFNGSVNTPRICILIPFSDLCDSSEKLIKVFILLPSSVIDKLELWSVRASEVDDLWVPGNKASFHWNDHWVSISNIEKELKSASCCSEIVENDNWLGTSVWVEPLEGRICYYSYIAMSESILIRSSCFATSCWACKPDNAWDSLGCCFKAFCV